MIRHAIAEGWLLLRHRGIISFTLALALAVPVCLAGVTLTTLVWLGPLIEGAEEDTVVAVLLHPEMDQRQRREWLTEQAERHPGWRLQLVPSDDLANRLIHWFPYLTDLFEDGGSSLLPPLVEIATEDSASLEPLRASPAVIAIGPRSSVQRIAASTARTLSWILGAVSAILLGAAVLLAVVWVHLELFRHADEITIMRLVGATEATIRGPFLVAVLVPAALAAATAALGTLALTTLGSRVTTALGLPPLAIQPVIFVLQAALAWLLPIVAAAVTLGRHAVAELDG